MQVNVIEVPGLELDDFEVDTDVEENVTRIAGDAAVVTR